MTVQWKTKRWDLELDYYMSLHRADKIKEICDKTPYITLQTLSDEFGISRERVRQIIVQYNKDHPDDQIVRKTPIGKMHSYKCTECGKQLNKKTHEYSGLCRPCGKKSREIRGNCTLCGKPVIKSGMVANSRRQAIKLGLTNPDHIFCNNTCAGKFVGKNFGFASSKGYANRTNYSGKSAWEQNPKKKKRSNVW